MLRTFRDLLESTGQDANERCILDWNQLRLSSPGTRSQNRHSYLVGMTDLTLKWLILFAGISIRSTGINRDLYALVLREASHTIKISVVVISNSK